MAALKLENLKAAIDSYEKKTAQMGYQARQYVSTNTRNISRVTAEVMNPAVQGVAKSTAIAMQKLEPRVSWILGRFDNWSERRAQQLSQAIRERPSLHAEVLENILLAKNLRDKMVRLQNTETAKDFSKGVKGAVHSLAKAMREGKTNRKAGYVPLVQVEPIRKMLHRAAQKVAKAVRPIGKNISQSASMLSKTARDMKKSLMNPSDEVLKKLDIDVKTTVQNGTYKMVAKIDGVELPTKSIDDREFRSIRNATPEQKSFLARELVKKYYFAGVPVEQQPKKTQKSPRQSEAVARKAPRHQQTAKMRPERTLTTSQKKTIRF